MNRYVFEDEGDGSTVAVTAHPRHGHVAVDGRWGTSFTSVELTPKSARKMAKALKRAAAEAEK